MPSHTHLRPTSYFLVLELTVQADTFYALHHDHLKAQLQIDP